MIFDIFEIFGIFDISDMFEIFDIFEVFDLFGIFEIFDIFDIFEIFEVAYYVYLITLNLKFLYLPDGCTYNQLYLELFSLWAQSLYVSELLMYQRSAYRIKLYPSVQMFYLQKYRTDIRVSL